MKAAMLTTIVALALTANEGVASESPDQFCPSFLKETIADHNLKPSRTIYKRAHRLCLQWKTSEAKTVLLKGSGKRRAVRDHRSRRNHVVRHHERPNVVVRKRPRRVIRVR